MRVLVTRPEPGAARTVLRLAGLGFTPVQLPLTEIVPLPVDLSRIPGKIDAVAVTSANALRHAPASLLAMISRIPCFAVGGETAAEARARGLATVEEGSGDAEALADLVAERIAPGGRVLYPCGKLRLNGFEERLSDAGLSVLPVETYDTRGIDHPPETLARVLGTEPIDAVLLYSAEAARLFGMLAWPPATGPLLVETKFLCMSERVAERLERVDRSRVRVASEPSEAALFGLLEHR